MSTSAARVTGFKKNKVESPLLKELRLIFILFHFFFLLVFQRTQITLGAVTNRTVSRVTIISVSERHCLSRITRKWRFVFNFICTTACTGYLN